MPGESRDEVCVSLINQSNSTRCLKSTKRYGKYTWFRFIWITDWKWTIMSVDKTQGFALPPTFLGIGTSGNSSPLATPTPTGPRWFCHATYYIKTKPNAEILLGGQI
jgi:hypothetical protein